MGELGGKLVADIIEDVSPDSDAGDLTRRGDPVPELDLTCLAADVRGECFIHGCPFIVVVVPGQTRGVGPGLVYTVSYSNRVASSPPIAGRWRVRTGQRNAHRGQPQIHR